MVRELRAIRKWKLVAYQFEEEPLALIRVSENTDKQRSRLCVCACKLAFCTIAVFVNGERAKGRSDISWFEYKIQSTLHCFLRPDCLKTQKSCQ